MDNEIQILESSRAKSHWYCVQTKPKEERYALYHLRRQNFEAFLPMVKSRKLYRYKLKWITSPMFPRYLFARMDDMEHMLKIRSTHGVSRLVSFGHVPAKVPYDIISEIRVRCVDDVFVVKDREFEKGDKITIIDGPYGGMNAIFDRKTSDERRVVILLELMSSVANIEIDRNSVIKDG